jgi:hypothetical protein
MSDKPTVRFAVEFRFIPSRRWEVEWDAYKTLATAQKQVAWLKKEDQKDGWKGTRYRIVKWTGEVVE